MFQGIYLNWLQYLIMQIEIEKDWCTADMDSKV